MRIPAVQRCRHESRDRNGDRSIPQARPCSNSATTKPTAQCRPAWPLDGTGTLRTCARGTHRATASRLHRRSNWLSTGLSFAEIQRSWLGRRRAPAGVWLSNYIAKTIVVRNADVQGMRTGISSPFYQEFRAVEPGRGDGLGCPLKEGQFRDYIGIVIATVYSSSAEAGGAIKKAVVRDAVFEPLNVTADPLNPPAAISMNYRMASGDPDPRDPIAVYNFNKKPGDNFKVYYSLEAPPKVAPCQDTRSDIGGWVCK